jgi:hypothetical protein
VVSNDFWQVELMVGMGPLLLGVDEDAIQKVLVERGIDAEPRFLGNARQRTIPSIKTRLTFSEANPRTLTHIEVDDERLRFASLSVLGKRAYQIIGIFKVSRKETLWTRGNSSIEENAEPFRGNMSPELSRELLAKGTLWIKKYGLGLTMRDGLVATVHLCDPNDVPRDGLGQWTKEQQLLSEVHEVVAQEKEPIQRSLKSAARGLVHVAFVFVFGLLVWSAISLQRKWDEAAEVPAVVVALEPPPPHPLPNNITVEFRDSSGARRSTTLGFQQFERTPMLGDEVSVVFLPETPHHVLGPVAARDVGFSSTFPFGLGTLLAYTILLLLLGGMLRTKSNKTF